MAETHGQHGTKPSTIGKVLERLKPRQGARHFISVLILMAAALLVVAIIALGILANRNAYFEQRNLRELDRIATEVNNARENLAQAATLHFVPNQLHFSLSRQVECLVASTEIMGAHQQPITINYYFTDPEGTSLIAGWYAAQTPRNPPATSRDPPRIASRNLPPDLCGYQRPLGLGLDLDQRTRIAGGQIQLERTAQLRNLLWPMTANRRPESRDLSACLDRPGSRNLAAPVTDARSFIRNCFLLAANEDMTDETYSYRDAGQIRQVVAQSIDAAIRSNTIRINASMPTAALDLNSALATFDAVQIIGSDPDHKDRPILLLQAGRVPAAIESDEGDQARTLGMMLGVEATPQNQPPADSRRETRPSGESDFLSESRIARTSDLVLFQRTIPRLAGLNCKPCRIVGIVDRAKFDRTVRKIDGFEATTFLIGLLTLIGLIPLLQLKLRRHLDATGRTGQYFIWFSLTLLAASASVSCFAILSSSASRTAGVIASDQAIGAIKGSFAAELHDSVLLVAQIGSNLKRSDIVFPAPETLATPDRLRQDHVAEPNAVALLDNAREERPASAIIDMVAYFRRDGFVDRETTRIAASRFPAFGTPLADRPYFLRAKNRNYDSIPLPECGKADTSFILDRVFARPDGAPRVIWVLPGGCRAEGPSFPKQDLDATYDPTRREFLVASGTMRTFIGAELPPGFNYAVIDPHRPVDDANVLFHSRPGAELVERFQQEIDDPEGFDALVRHALAGPVSDGAGDAGRPADHPLRMDTHYHAQPTRLTIIRLHPTMDWILVIIENRNDAGFAVWRAATFGYAIWFVGALGIALILLVCHIRNSTSLDRRPGLSLWPRRRLKDFTPPLLARQVTVRDDLRQAAISRDRHIWRVFWAGLIGILAAEGASRILLALAAGSAGFAARAYFKGLTAVNRSAAGRNDRHVIRASGGLLLLAAITFKFVILTDFALGPIVHGDAEWWDWAQFGLRYLAFYGAVLAIARCLVAASAQRYRDPAPVKDRASRMRTFLQWAQTLKILRTMSAWRIWRRMRTWPNHEPRTDIGWIVALVILGGLPAAAGFLDSHDLDSLLVAQRTEQLSGELNLERSQAVQEINIARLTKLPDCVIDQIVQRPLEFGVPRNLCVTPKSPPRTRQITAGMQCYSLSCIAIDYLGLHEQALTYSDFAPFKLSQVVSSSRGITETVTSAFLIAVPLFLLFLAFLFFRQQYFRRPPFLSPGKDPEFDPPLSFTRERFIAGALVAAARGRDPQLPFVSARGNRHLILGVDLDLREDPIPGEDKRVGEEAGIAWIDLLDPSAWLAPKARAVVIGNLDLALQVQDNGATARRTFETIRRVAGSAGAHGTGERHIFLLADIDPLDRIALLWERQGGDEATSLVEGWRWAELIQDFILCPIRSEDPVPDESGGEGQVRRLIREELGVLDTAFAHELGEQLAERIENAPARAADAVDAEASAREADRIISFITEQMSDHYYKLWASSSEEERVMLYRVARGCHLKMQDSRALRSLLARGVLVRVPEYRLMNWSFSRYVCRIGATSSIQNSAERAGGLDWVWPLIRYPLAVVAGACVLLLQFVAPSNAGAAVGALPALLALIPAMLGKWFQDRTGAT